MRLQVFKRMDSAVLHRRLGELHLKMIYGTLMFVTPVPKETVSVSEEMFASIEPGVSNSIRQAAKIQNTH